MQHNRRIFRMGCVIFVFAFLIRILYLLESSDTPTYSIPLVDEKSYCELAGRFAQTGDLKADFFWQPFFYPFFLSLVFFIAGPALFWIKVIQFVLGSLTCVLTFLLGLKIFDRSTGFIAGLITCLYCPLIFFDGQILATGWAAFWSVAIILLYLRTRLKKSYIHFLLLGFCGALCIITRPTFLPFIIAAGIWLGAAMFREYKATLKPVLLSLCFILGFLICSLPVALLCHRITGRFTILPSSGAVNMYIGNNPDSCKTLTIRPSWAWEKLVMTPSKYGAKTEKDFEDYFYRETRHYIFNQPFSFIKGLARKCLQFMGSREIPRNDDIYLFRKWSVILSLLVWKWGHFGFPFGVLLPLALVGLFYERRRIPAPLWLYLILFPSAVILVFVSARYRAPAIPLFAVLAAAGLKGFHRLVTERKILPLILFSGCGLIIILLASVPGPFCEENVNYEAEYYVFLGSEAKSAEQAISYLSKALALNPDIPEAHNMLGSLLNRKGKEDEGIQHFSKACLLNPEFPDPRFNLGVVYSQKKMYPEAEKFFREALRLNPDLPLVNYRLAVVLSKLGRNREALVHYRQAVQLQPDMNEAAYKLAWILCTNPSDDLRSGKEAVAIAKDLCQRTGNKEPLYLDTLAAAYAEVGQFEEAQKTAAQALDLARSLKRDALAKAIEARIDLYNNRTPFRE